MTWAGPMRLCARRIAMRRMSGTDQRIKGWAGLLSRVSFFGRRVVRPMPDCCHHGEGEHGKRDLAMPAMPGAGLVMVESQFILGRLETILDRPTMTLDHDQGFDASSNRTPSGEEREVPISDVAAD